MNSTAGLVFERLPLPARPVSVPARTTVGWATATGWDGAAYGIRPVGLVLLAAPRRSSERTAASGRAGQGIPEPGARGTATTFAQVRGVLAEQVVISTLLDPFLSLRALAAYSGMSVRKLRDCLADPFHPLPHYRMGGKILVRRSEFDTWTSAYRASRTADVDRIVSAVLADRPGAQ